MISIEVKNANLRYREQTLFDHLTLSIPAGQITALLGPSGCGKSTLCRLLAGLDFDDDTVCQADIQTSDKQPLAGRVAYMAQQPALMPWLTALDNVLLPLQLQEPADAETQAKANELLKQVGLANASKCRPKYLSGGMKQRVALAQTLMADKQVVILDEPFSALDAISRWRMQELAVQTLAGKTVLMVTHDPLEAARMADHVLVMGNAPAEIIETLELKSPKPRTLEDPVVTQTQQQVMDALHLTDAENADAPQDSINKELPNNQFTS